ncbi:MAG TPA: ABC transporter substrate-binding protein [Candidatus Dormibacteraeota bacterium]|nr:ABC transporter substrate-binding protein [Candidatus Dormibacteraeota bacterium]
MKRMLIALLALVAACGTSAQSAAPSDNGPLTLRLGYFPNLTHAPAMAGLSKGFFASSLGGDVTLETHTFNAGGDAVTAILSGSIDASFVGPNPTTNAFAQSHGEAIRVVAGATSGGALLVVKPSITSTAELKGKRIADPQLGGTQDVALRWFLKSNGLHSDTAGGGDVSILPQDNSQTLTAFKQGQIDGAWVPEPWASRLVVEGHGKVLVDERDLWPQGSS